MLNEFDIILVAVKTCHILSNCVISTIILIIVYFPIYNMSYIFLYVESCSISVKNVMSEP